MKKKVIGGIVAVIALVFAGKLAYSNWKYEETDDAHTAANSAVLSAKVGGSVTEILVHENQLVRAGDVLLKIDARDFQNQVDVETAELEALQAKLKEALKDQKRMRALLASETVSQQQADSAEAKFGELARREVALKAHLSQAQLALEYAVVKAPTDGKVGRRAVEKGVVVGPGQPLIAFVESTEYWVVANYKETQLQNMKIGQSVEVKVDAIGGHVFEGKVEGFAPGSGATFAVIPPDNATGNYVKVVQRVPVRISLSHEALKGFEDRFVPGLSVVTSVLVR